MNGLEAVRLNLGSRVIAFRLQAHRILIPSHGLCQRHGVSLQPAYQAKLIVVWTMDLPYHPTKSPKGSQASPVEAVDR